jgi:NAD(P)-dependent dehydrogenase (short-subunit alcohol dehydrogenase family)
MSKTVLITGASGKLGSAIAKHLANCGWNLVLTSRDIKRCSDLTKELLTTGVSVNTVELDLLDDKSSDSLAKRIADMQISITHIVSNARSLDTLNLDENGVASTKNFIDELSIDVVAPYRAMMGFVSNPCHNLRGIVTIGSQYGVVGPNPSLYNGELGLSPVQYGVSKAALHHLARELSIRLAPDIRVNCIAYGGFSGRVDDEFQKRYAKLLPIRRMLNEDDAGGPVAFLIDDFAAAAVTGHVLVVDGGWSVW